MSKLRIQPRGPYDKVFVQVIDDGPLSFVFGIAIKTNGPCYIFLKIRGVQKTVKHEICRNMDKYCFALIAVQSERSGATYIDLIGQIGFGLCLIHIGIGSAVDAVGIIRGK